MPVKKKLFITSIALMLIGVAMMIFVDTKGPEPKFTCASANGPTAGFSDSSQNNCAVSIESYNKWSEWFTKPNYGKIAGLGVVVVGLVVGVVGLVKRSNKANI